MDENLKRRIKDLGEAINHSLSESEPIADAIARVKREGYEVFLVLEATIGFSRQEETEPAGAKFAGELHATDHGRAKTEPKFEVSAQDMNFLKSMRITVDK